jgi:hypothetical protein
MNLKYEKEVCKMAVPKGKVWTICGWPKTGKSHFAMTFPKLVVFDFEKGTEELSGDIVKRLYITDLIEFEREMKALEVLVKKQKIETIVIDTVNSLTIKIEKDILERKGAQSMADLEYGIGWETQKAILMRYIDSLMTFCVKDINLLLLMHSKTSEGRKTFLVQDRLQEYIKGISWTVGFTHKRRRAGRLEFLIDFSGDETIDAGSRNLTLNQLRDIPNTYQALSSYFADSKGEEQEQKLISFAMSNAIDYFSLEKVIKENVDSSKEPQKIITAILQKAQKNNGFCSFLRNSSPNFDFSELRKRFYEEK